MGQINRGLGIVLVAALFCAGATPTQAFASRGAESISDAYKESAFVHVQISKADQSEVRVALQKLQRHLDLYMKARREARESRQLELIGDINHDLARLNKLKVATRIKPYAATDISAMNLALRDHVSFKQTAFVGKEAVGAFVSACTIVIGLSMFQSGKCEDPTDYIARFGPRRPLNSVHSARVIRSKAPG